MQVVPNPLPQSIEITNEYLWLPELYSVPARISYDVVCHNEKDEFIPCFSFNRQEWNEERENCDALSWYLSPHRDEFTFRTKLFTDFPNVERLAAPFKPAVGEKVRVTCEVLETSATYFVNGKPYATTSFDPGDVPTQGYFGFAPYATENITVSDIKVGEIPVLPNPVPDTIGISDKYQWIQDRYALPAKISCEVICNDEKDEFLPCFSYTRAEWDSPDCDALSWYLSPHRDDFTFRTQLFRNFPTVQRHVDAYKPAVGEKVTVSCEITATSATYSINGKPYATATYAEGNVPTQGYFGFAVYSQENITVENVQIQAREAIVS